MSAAFGVRLMHCGPNQLAVLAKARPLLKQPPAKVKQLVLGSKEVVLALDIGRSEAEGLVEEFRRMGAVAEVFVSIPCPS
jgi:hypothetical protein